nr:L,D-transpeptidase [Cohnella thailandensis]
MTAWFEELNEELTKVDGKLPSAAGWPESSGPEAGSGKPAGKLAALSDRPLEIIVDKANHRLAVVSGNVLLRNYEIGLGAGRTPEGQFVITEKVRDPNGSSTGPFGSRGMTLSDTLYAIHGTDEPDSIGKDESKGCIRMNKEDLEELYDLVSLGTKVTIIAKGLPRELRVPTERFHLEPAQNETNPDKKYEWLG